MVLRVLVPMGGCRYPRNTGTAVAGDGELDAVADGESSCVGYECDAVVDGLVDGDSDGVAAWQGWRAENARVGIDLAQAGA